MEDPDPGLPGTNARSPRGAALTPRVSVTAQCNKTLHIFE